MISQRSKPLYIYRVVVRPVLTYACQTWPLRVNDANRLKSFASAVCKKIKWHDYLPSAAVHQHCMNIEAELSSHRYQSHKRIFLRYASHECSGRDMSQHTGGTGTRGSETWSSIELHKVSVGQKSYRAERQWLAICQLSPILCSTLKAPAGSLSLTESPVNSTIIGLAD